MKYLVTFLLLGITSLGFTQTEQLIVFTDSKSTKPVVSDFNKTYLERVKALGKDLKIEVKVLQASNGLPEEVTSLPSIYYVNNGRKFFYKGRYGATDKIKTFIATQRTFGFDPVTLKKEGVFAMESGGFQTGLNIKVTKVNKEDAASTAPSDVKASVIKQLKKSLKKFEYQSTYEFVEQSKLYYLNIYPYLSKSGVYYISFEVFSQHSCKVPMFQKYDTPFTSSSLNKAIAQLATYFEKMTPQLFNDTQKTDGISPITGAVQRKSWKALGFEFTEGTEARQEFGFKSLKSGTYNYVENKKAAPISFTFLPPVSQYSGTIGNMTGRMSYFNKEISGKFIGKFASFDMGDPYLNESVLTEQLVVENFPLTSVAFKSSFDEIPFYEAVPITGKMELMGIKKDVIIETTFRPLSENEVMVFANFSFNINPFSTLEKPDGPSPENETIKVYATFKLKLN